MIKILRTSPMTGMIFCLRETNELSDARLLCNKCVSMIGMNIIADETSRRADANVAQLLRSFGKRRDGGHRSRR